MSTEGSHPSDGQLAEAHSESSKKCSSANSLTFKGPYQKNFFRPEKKITRDHLNTVFADDLMYVEKKEEKDQRLAALEQQVSEIKRDAKEWGKMKVQDMVVQNAIDLGLSNIHSVKGLQMHWQKHPDRRTAAIVWHCLYGAFDFAPRWDEILEQEYLAKNNMSYKDDGMGRKGCIASLFARCKRDVVRRVAKAGESKTKLFFKRNFEEPPDTKEKFEKRKKGQCIGPFAMIEGEFLMEPEKIIEQVRVELDVLRGKVQVLQEKTDEMMKLPYVMTPMVVAPSAHGNRSGGAQQVR